MFKLPALPSPRSQIHELADFAELLALQQGTVSVREILAYLGRVSENDPNEGIDDEDDQSADVLDDVFLEMDRRGRSCAGGYPFRLEHHGTVLRHDAADTSVRADAYRYLLLSTRLNMAQDKLQNDIDGTGLLEELAALVLRCYLGSRRAQSIVFGTAMGGGFREKVDALCAVLGEGGGFSSIDPAPVQANDDKLDAVAWIPFTDGRVGKVVIFCQCKTGTNWKEQVSQLQPDAFIHRWMSARSFLLTPVRAFCVSESTDPARWSGFSVYAGLLFDRLRVVDFLDQSDDALHARIRRWNVAAGAVAAQAMA